MREINRAERLLSLFTSPDSAAGIVGDLSEERGQRGGAWFWRHVLGTAFSLCCGTLTQSPLVVLMLAVLGFGIQILALVGASLPFFSATPSSYYLIAPTLILVTWFSALLTGGILVAVSRHRGMAACVVLAVALEIFYFAVSRHYISHAVPLPIFWVTTAFFTPTGSTFLLLGGAVVRMRQIRRQLRTAP
jgi:hypothetical protein